MSGELKLPGLTTGIDTATLVQQLMTVESQRLTQYQTKKTGFDTQSKALDQLRTKVSALEAATSPLSDADTLKNFSATSSNRDVLNVSATSDANPGSHSIEVNQLATSETWIQDNSGFKYTTDYVGDGKFIYSYNNQERTINTVAGQTTLQDFVNLINNDQGNPGVTASLLQQGGTYHLMLSGQQTGEDYQISINDKNTQVFQSGSLKADGNNAGLATKIVDLDSFSGTVAAGDNAYISIGGTRSDGTTFTTKLAVTSQTTVGQIIDELNSRFEVDGKRAATATLVDGKITLTDNKCGITSLVLNDLTFNPGTGHANLNPIMMTETVHGGPTDHLLQSFLPNSFKQTQDAQNSQIKINGYTPSQVSEKQVLSTNAAATGGTFTLSYKGQTTDPIAYNADFTTIQTALKKLSTIGDMVIKVDGNTLDSGPANMTFTFPGSEGNAALISINSSDLQGTDHNETIVETVKGNNSQWVSRNGNVISDALTGITLNLVAVSEKDDDGNPIAVQITISRNTGGVSNNIDKMVAAYNDLISELKTQTEYDPTTKKMGLLSRDVAASYMKSEVSSPLIGVIKGFVNTVDSFVQSSDIGITMKGDGTLEFDKTKFSDAVTKDFDGVLEALGATKSGNSTSNIIGFYGASKEYTRAGTYEVKVAIADHKITSVKIRMSGETEWRDNPVGKDGNFITGNSTFDTKGQPIYPENGLQLNVDLSQADGAYDATIHVKQGIMGGLDDILKKAMDTDGQLDMSKKILDDKSAAMQKTIDNEQTRLKGVQQRLTDKYARLEKTLTMLQQQQGAVTAMTGGKTS